MEEGHHTAEIEPETKTLKKRVLNPEPDPDLHREIRTELWWAGDRHADTGGI